MNSGMPDSSFRQYRAPKQTDGILVDPPISSVLSKLRQNVTASERPDWELSSLRRKARQEALGLAAKYTSDMIEESVSGAHVADCLVVSGHQPELFHPGVWFKNFLLHALVKQVDGVALNLIVDNDECKGTSLRVPRQGPEGFTIHPLKFDEPRQSLPWELRRLESLTTWKQFEEQATASLKTVGIVDPILRQLWPLATEFLDRGYSLGNALAGARLRLEWQKGLRNLELPLSRLVETDCFARFSLSILRELKRFQNAYNGQRSVYRKAHKIRNAAHPVPALTRQDGWLEAPFWVYHRSGSARHPLWVREANGQWILSDRQGWQDSLEGDPLHDAEELANQWREFALEGVLLRPRALITTMYVRLLIADEFVHGIGGGKYDQLTDRIVAEFFNIEPAPYVTATATLRMPFEGLLPTNSQELAREIEARQRTLWEWQKNADRRADELGPEAEKLARQKKELLDHIPPKGEKWEWHQKVREINERLQVFAAPKIESLSQEVESLKNQLRVAQAAESREFSFALFPSNLMEHLSELAAQSVS